jgi:hypothetical protein
MVKGAVTLVAIIVRAQRLGDELEQPVRVVHAGDEDDDDRDEGAQQPVAQLQQVRDQRPLEQRFALVGHAAGPLGGSSSPRAGAWDCGGWGCGG